MNKKNFFLFNFVLTTIIAVNLIAQPILVKDINTGAAGVSNPVNIVTIGNTAYFSATSFDSGAELWKTDGTPAGTVVIKDINPGFNNSNPQGFVSNGSDIFFTANDGTHGVELWKTDGTSGGTSLVKDIINGSKSSSPFALSVLAGKLYFIADDSVHGKELWVSDGTNNGTTLLKDINNGKNSSFNSQASFVAVGSALYFPTND
jgi:ELWxxDGT repeat protein